MHQPKIKSIIRYGTVLRVERSPIGPDARITLSMSENSLPQRFNGKIIFGITLDKDEIHEMFGDFFPER